MGAMKNLLIEAMEDAPARGIDDESVAGLSSDDLERLRAEMGLASLSDDGVPGRGEATAAPLVQAEKMPAPLREWRHHDGTVARPVTADMPTIELLGGGLAKAATEAERALLQSGIPVYQRDSSLVRPVLDEVPASKGRRTFSARFSEISWAGARDIMAQSATWTRYDERKKRWMRCDPPRSIAEVLLSRQGEWAFPKASGIITTPTLRPDFSILREPGYDPATRLYHAQDPSLVLPEIPDRPTRDEAMVALKMIDDLLVNFPFVTNIDRSVALSAILTTVCRGAMSVVPMHAFRAPTAGTGKSYLIDVASSIAAGRPCPAMSAGHDMDEMDKRLAGHLLAGYPIILIDNVNKVLGSDLLCQATERTLLRVRKLGGSGIYEIESGATLFANGNGFAVHGDLTRRTLVCDLDAEMERPELRDFTFSPVERVLSDRGAYVAAALTVVRAFVISGDRPHIFPLASYEDYTATVRGALVWLGYPDPALSMERAREDDPDLSSLRAVMGQWLHHVGLNVETSCKTLAQSADMHRHDDYGRMLPEYTHGELRDALLAIAPGRQGIDTVRLGKWLKSKKGRVVMMTLPDGQRVRMRFESGGATDGSVRWRLASF